LQATLPDNCSSCNTAITRLRVALIGKSPQHPKLQACGVTWEDTQTSIHLDITPDTRPDLPGHCWRRA
jgi:hypothetical protein